MKTTTPIYCMCTFFFFNTKPIACNNDVDRNGLHSFSFIVLVQEC